MPIADVIAMTDQPITSQRLVQDLIRIGMKAGQTVLVHSSLASLGWVCGGAVAVIESLIGVLGASGTLVMPCFTTDLTEPSDWRRPPVPPEWCDEIRATMPAFDVRKTPTNNMGAIAELFRTWPGVVRSNHPTSSFSALGPLANVLVASHPLDDPVGESSPIGRMYHVNAKILLLGVGHHRNTSIHLAERKRFGDHQVRVRNGSPIMEDGLRQWVEYDEPDLNGVDLGIIGHEFELANVGVSRGQVGFAESVFMDQQALVDFAVDWFKMNRPCDTDG